MASSAEAHQAGLLAWCVSIFYIQLCGLVCFQQACLVGNVHMADCRHFVVAYEALSYNWYDKQGLLLNSVHPFDLIKER